MTVVVSILFLIMGDILGVISGLDLVKEHSKYRQLGQPRIVNGEDADIRNYPFTLSHPVEPSPWIGFVRVLQSGELLEIGTECVALGWGSIYAVEPLIKKRNALNMTNPPITNRNLERSKKQYLLQMVYLRLISQEDCYQRLRVFDPVLSERNLCTFQEEKDACQGDSGGPLYCEEKLAAVVSYGYGCAWKQLPGIFYGVNDTKWLTRAEQIIWSSSSAVIFFQNIVFLSLFTLCLWIVRYVQHAADLVTLLLSSSVLDYVDPSENIPTEVEFILAHEGFDFNTLENDIALLKLARPLKTTQFAPLLPVNNFWGINDLQGEECMLAGWGAFRFIISEFVNQWNITERLIMVNETASLLQKTSLDVVTPAECSLLTPHSLWKMDNLLCAYKGGKSACVGDAGSPLICDGYVVGFLSWHGGCVRDTPGVFHRIDKLMGWLKRAIYRSRMQIQYRSKAPAASQNLTFLLFITVLFKYN